MAHPQELDTLSKSFSGFGVDERSIVTILGKWQPEHRKTFRKCSTTFFREDERLFEKWDADHIALLKREFSRFKNAVVLWTMHPWERDTRLAKEALIKENRSYDVLIEIACTRSSEELLGARKAYHSLFDHSIEEDVASHIHGTNRNLFVALVSAYRYEGSKVNDEVAKSEAKILCNAVKNAKKKNPIEDEEVIRIVSTRSKLHLKAIYKHYKDNCSKTLDEDLEYGSSLKEAIMCLCSPQAYFSKVLNASMKNGADEKTKVALTRVVVTRADHNIKEIEEEYQTQNGVSLSQKIKETIHGNYKDFLLSLIERGERK
ncbi:annexin D4-like [Macadamia integrifolia]|uniref:annexin D4-like n=1 Tax=Macadamia integrifolia TaxID=60698 RepID=UPI001C4FB09D|nr:annexin D4-like [Macadamia integrifolia]